MSPEKYECDYCCDEIEPEDLFCFENMTFHEACYKQKYKDAAPTEPCKYREEIDVGHYQCTHPDVDVGLYPCQYEKCPFLPEKYPPEVDWHDEYYTMKAACATLTLEKQEWEVKYEALLNNRSGVIEACQAQCSQLEQKINEWETKYEQTREHILTLTNKCNEWEVKYDALKKSWDRNNDALSKAQEWEAKYHALKKQLEIEDMTSTTLDQTCKDQLRYIKQLEQALLRRVLQNE